MTAVAVLPRTSFRVRTRDERRAYLLLFHGFVVRFHRIRPYGAPRSAKDFSTYTPATRVPFARLAFNDQSIGCRFWKYLSIAKQAIAAKRCFSVCPLRTKLR